MANWQSQSIKYKHWRHRDHFILASFGVAMPAVRTDMSLSEQQMSQTTKRTPRNNPKVYIDISLYNDIKNRMEAIQDSQLPASAR